MGDPDIALPKNMWKIDLARTGDLAWTGNLAVRNEVRGSVLSEKEMCAHEYELTDPELYTKSVPLYELTNKRSQRLIIALFPTVGTSSKTSVKAKVVTCTTKYEEMRLSLRTLGIKIPHLLYEFSIPEREHSLSDISDDGFLFPLYALEARKAQLERLCTVSPLIIDDLFNVKNVFLYYLEGSSPKSEEEGNNGRLEQRHKMRMDLAAPTTIVLDIIVSPSLSMRSVPPISSLIPIDKDFPPIVLYIRPSMSTNEEMLVEDHEGLFPWHGYLSA
ncbi:hypothetical protein J1N35_021615 [Gossypium stocksii]|uniref:Uncharacterized protein n=1 Tax=Gossypium stocksii TaxID=47602 RepID=A0A9D3VG90_9ROSI|nr:hypothetical protein J1N35_021615 [Gossypium stocksii]